MQAAEPFDDTDDERAPLLPLPPALSSLKCPRCGGRCSWSAEPDELARATAAELGLWHAPGVWVPEPWSGDRATYGCATLCPHPRCSEPLALALGVRALARPNEGLPLLDHEGYCRFTAIDSAELVLLDKFLQRHRAHDFWAPSASLLGGAVRACLAALLAFLPAAGFLLIFARQGGLRGPYPSELFLPSCALAALAALFASSLPKRLRKRAAHRLALAKQAVNGEGAVTLERGEGAGGYRLARESAPRADPSLGVRPLFNPLRDKVGERLIAQARGQRHLSPAGR